jgi:hypothetical protein
LQWATVLRHFGYSQPAKNQNAVAVSTMETHGKEEPVCLPCPLAGIHIGTSLEKGCSGKYDNKAQQLQIEN